MQQSPPYGQMPMPEQSFAEFAAEDARAQFIKKTYLHLAGAIGVFALLEALLLQVPGIRGLIETMVSGYNWLIVLGLFLVVGYVAERMARRAVSLSSQYAGLAIYILAEAVIFLPLIYVAQQLGRQIGVNIIATAAVATIAMFGALTVIVFLTRKDFSFLRSALWMGGFVALGLIVCSIVFNFELGYIFTVAMIGFASLWVLYDTSKVLHDYRTDQYVVASLALFASLALLFWYILRLALWFYMRSED